MIAAAHLQVGDRVVDLPGSDEPGFDALHNSLETLGDGPHQVQIAERRVSQPGLTYLAFASGGWSEVIRSYTNARLLVTVE